MIVKTARFQVKPDTVDACVRAITEFTHAVGANEPDTLFYTAYQEADDPTSFLHVFAFRDAAAEEHHRVTEHVKRFVDVLYPQTVDGVTFTDYRLVATTD